MTFDEQIKKIACNNYCGEESSFIAGANAAREILRGEMLVKAGDINRKVETELVLAYEKIEKLRADLQIAVEAIRLCDKNMHMPSWVLNHGGRIIREALAKIEGNK